MRGIIDLHCDTLLECYVKKKDLKCWDGHINLEKLRRGGAMAQCFAAFLPTRETLKEYPEITCEDSYELFLDFHKLYQRELMDHCDVLAEARTCQDVERNWKEGKISTILTVEDGVLLDGKIERVKALADMGVKMITLTWNYENSVGFPCSRDAEKHALGLKPFGLEALDRMNRLGIIADVSHLSEGGFMDVAVHSKKPFAASHSCARALCDHPRNLTDQQLRILGEKGGVVGINFYALFLTEESSCASNERILEHMVHIADKAGVDALALGSDFDGIGTELEMKDYAGYPTLIRLLEKKFTASEVEKITSGNFLRLLGDNQ